MAGLLGRLEQAQHVVTDVHLEAGEDVQRWRPKSLATVLFCSTRCVRNQSRGSVF
jgi:hypothetical protein